jgi:Ubiquitin-activating enzyme E1 FCCH domain
MSGSILPTVMTSTGLQPATPAQLNAQLYAMALALSPGLTVLPGGLIADLGGTGTGALTVMEAARVDVINSVSPLLANPFLLYQLGAVYGVEQGQGSNGSVYVVFTGNAAGIIIPIGFTVSDGTNQYTIQDGGVTGSSLQTLPLFALASQPGSFPIPPTTVTTIVTSLSGTGITLSVTNPLAGTPQQSPQTIAAYRSVVLQAGIVASVGTPAFTKSLIEAVPGVNPALVSIRTVVGVGWEIIVGGSGDPYQIANAILQGVGDIAFLVGSTLGVANITAATNGVVTTTLNHGYSTGQAVTIAGVTPTGYNQTYASVTVLTETTFETNVNTSSYGAYASGGVCTPNFRNQSITLNNYPDSYTIPFVIPPAQTVAMAVDWNTSSVSYVSATAVASLVSNALANYVNGLPIGAPMNVDVMIAVFQQAVVSILPAALISIITFSVTINSVSTSPAGGTVLISGDPESYFTTTPAAIVVTQL